MPFVEQDFKPQPVMLDSLAADLSVRGMRERAFRAELELIAQNKRHKAQKLRERAGRLPVDSNGRAKKLAHARRLEEHAETLEAATVDRVAA